MKQGADVAKFFQSIPKFFNRLSVCKEMRFITVNLYVLNIILILLLMLLEAQVYLCSYGLKAPVILTQQNYNAVG